MERYDIEGIIVLVFILYMYMLAPALCLVVQMNIHKYRKRFSWLAALTLLSSIGIIIVTYAEAIYIDNNGLSGSEYDWIKYFIWATVHYILIAGQIIFGA